jgi:ectoine hydroxylase-related dioxygenase (phytanoyl-CoA dioxygenase family)
VQILENMLTVRVHLDDCDESNGPLKVLPGSHRRGRLTEQAIEAAQQAQSPVVCTTSAGGVLLMRPLLLHASSPAGHPGHRRVIHIDYANSPLPNGLEWFSERP